MGWFDDNHWAGEAYDFGFGYMCGGHGTNNYSSHRNPINNHYTAGTRKCGECKVFKTKKDFTAEQAARPAGSRVCKVCQRKSGGSSGGKKHKAAAREESSDEEGHEERGLLEVDAILEGPRGSGKNAKYRVHWFGPDTEEELRSLSGAALKLRATAAGVAVSGKKDEVVSRILESETTWECVADLPPTLVQSQKAQQALQQAERKAVEAEDRAAKAEAAKAEAAKAEATPDAAASEVKAEAPDAAASITVVERQEEQAYKDELFAEGREKRTKTKALSCTIERKAGEKLGVAIAGNYVTAVHAGGAAAKEGTLQVGDVITEVNGRDANLEAFANLLPKDATVPLKLRIAREVEVGGGGMGGASSRRGGGALTPAAAAAAAAAARASTAEVEAKRAAEARAEADQAAAAAVAAKAAEATAWTERQLAAKAAAAAAKAAADRAAKEAEERKEREAKERAEAAERLQAQRAARQAEEAQRAAQRAAEREARERAAMVREQEQLAKQQAAERAARERQAERAQEEATRRRAEQIAREGAQAVVQQAHTKLQQVEAQVRSLAPSLLLPSSTTDLLVSATALAASFRGLGMPAVEAERLATQLAEAHSELRAARTHPALRYSSAPVPKPVPPSAPVLKPAPAPVLKPASSAAVNPRPGGGVCCPWPQCKGRSFQKAAHHKDHCNAKHGGMRAPPGKGPMPTATSQTSTTSSSSALGKRPMEYPSYPRPMGPPATVAPSKAFKTGSASDVKQEKEPAPSPERVVYTRYTAPGGVPAEEPKLMSYEEAQAKGLLG